MNAYLSDCDMRLAQRRESDKLRKREERRNWTPAQREADKNRKRTARQSRTPAQREADNNRKRQERRNWTDAEREAEKVRNQLRTRTKPLPFMAVDGEGGGD